jgi:proteasome accessory factor A
MRTVSHDTSCRTPLELADGRSITAIELQWEYLRLAKKYVQEYEDQDEITGAVVDRWEHVLDRLEDDPMTLARELDWVAKLSLLDAYRDRDSLGWDHPKLRLIDLQYHDVQRAKGLYWKLESSGKVETIVSDAEIDHAVDHPPEDTRAYFRGECLRRFSPVIVAASWDALIFDTGDEPLRKVPTMEPMRGTKQHVQSILDDSPDASRLLANLSR